MTDSQPDNISGTTPDNALSNIEAQPFSVGAALREARTRLGLSVSDVSNRLKFAPRQIEALEMDDFARLPEITFVRGFVRSYAMLLQLAPDSLLAALPETPAKSTPLVSNTLAELPFFNTYSTRKLNLIWLTAAFVVAIALVLLAWLHGNGPGVPKATHVETLILPAALPASAVPDSAMPDGPAIAVMPQVVAPAVQQAIVSPAKPVAAISPSRQAAAIQLMFDEDSWVEVTDKEGRVLLSQLNLRGSEQNLNGKPPFSVVIGRASGVHLYYKGQAVDLAPRTHAEVARLTLE